MILPEDLQKIKDENSFPNYFEFLYELVEGLKPKVVVEIGTHAGISASFLKGGYPGMELYTIDIDPESGWLIRDSSIIQIKRDSKYALEDVPKEIDLLFIDGDHTLEGCQSDYDLYAPLVKKGGIILVDDIFGSEGVRDFWKNLGIGAVIPGIHGKHGMGIIYK